LRRFQVGEAFFRIRCTGAAVHVAHRPFARTLPDRRAANQRQSGERRLTARATAYARDLRADSGFLATALATLRWFAARRSGAFAQTVDAHVQAAPVQRILEERLAHLKTAARLGHVTSSSNVTQ